MMEAEEINSVNSEDETVSIEQLVSVAKKILQITSRLDQTFQGAIPLETDGSALGADKSETMKVGLRYARVVRTMLQEVLEFLESPLGVHARSLVFQYADSIMKFVEVGAGTVAVSFFLVIGQELLDLNEEDFNDARNSIEASIAFVKNVLPTIEEKLQRAVELLPKIRNEKNKPDREGLGWSFKEDMRLAKLDIADCEDKLNRTSQDISKALEKIQARIILNGVVKGAVLSGGALAVYYFIKNKFVSMGVGLAIGAAGLALWSLGIPQPYYRKLKKDFESYERAQEDLHVELKRLKRRLQRHEEAFGQV